jgi:hypothetical protein
VEQALDGFSNYKKWQRTNPDGGHNDEWIEWPTSKTGVWADNDDPR